MDVALGTYVHSSKKQTESQGDMKILAGLGRSRTGLQFVDTFRCPTHDLGMLQ